MRRGRLRRYNKPKPPERLKEPALIECHGKADDDPVHVAIGNERYVFISDHAGRKTAQVYVVDHIDCFLARPEMYRRA